MTMNFADATALTELEPGRFAIDLDPQWSIGPKLHGGYLLALMGKAAAAVQDTHPHPTAITGSFLTAPAPGPAELVATVLRSGRSTTNVRVDLEQDGQVTSQAFVTQGVLTADDAWWTAAKPVVVPDIDECLRIPSDPPGDIKLPLMAAVDIRLNPGQLGFAVGKPTRNGVLSGWMQLEDGTEWTPESLLLAVDAPPPVSLDLGIYGWAPTIQLSSYVRRIPAPGPVRFEIHANDVGDDRMDEQCFVWDSAGRLVAQGVQLAGVRLPDGA